MPEEKELSVIIPVYNGARYLEKMMAGILKQTFTDFELLVVDNNSTDGTVGIIENYARKDGRVRCLRETKPGVSAARNTALRQVRGKYVMFLDADDWVDEDYFENFVKSMDGADLVCGGYRAYFEKGEADNLRYECFYESPQEENTVYTVEEMLERLFRVTHYQGYVWNKCYRTKEIRKRELCFQEDISYNEDRLFTVEYLTGCRGKVKMLGVNGYHYILHAGNAVSAEINEFPAEKEFTEIEAFSRMLPCLKGYPGALDLARKNMAERELLLFSRMIDPHGFARYRKSREMRYHARHFGQLNYLPQNQKEKTLCRKLVLYGWTGICYGKKQ